MDVLDSQRMTTRHRHTPIASLLRLKPRLQLKTFLMVFVTSVFLSLWYSVHLQRTQALRRLIHMETAAGYPRIQNLDAIEISPRSPGKHGVNRYRRTWSVWVPYGKSAILHYATEGLVVARPQSNRGLRLPHGRHDVEVWIENGVAALSVDGDLLDYRIPSSDWNLSVPFKSALNTSKTTEAGAVDLVETYGVARLKSHESYDPHKHRIGLCIWISDSQGH